MSNSWYEAVAAEADYDLTITIPGDAEIVRSRLPQALERLSYKVISEQPVMAKRGAVGGAQYACSFEPLDYPTKLTIGLKPLNQMATQATFSYEIKSAGWGLYEGDKDTLRREAEAVAALAMYSGVAMSCAACGAETVDDSRFCRRCGALLRADAPELEVYRLTRGARASLRDLGVGLAFMLLPALVLLGLYLGQPALKPKAVLVISILLGIVSIFGFCAVGEGLWELYRTLNPKETKGNLAFFTERPATAPPALAGAPVNALPPRPARFSVTEATTNLLTPEPVQAPMFQEPRDTAEMEAPRARRASADI
jgi:hypothetical protein